MELKDRLKIARERAGLSQHELARQAGVRQQTIHKLEKGIIKRSSYLFKISQILGVQVEWLVNGVDQVTEPKEQIRQDDVLNTVRILQQRVSLLEQRLAHFEFFRMLLKSDFQIFVDSRLHGNDGFSESYRTYAEPVEAN